MKYTEDRLGGVGLVCVLVRGVGNGSGTEGPGPLSTLTIFFSAAIF